MGIKGEIIEWLKEFETCVNTEDYDRGEVLFHDDSSCFGSKAIILHNREDLIENQWRKIWANITDFKYDLDSLSLIISDDKKTVCAACLWDSTGYAPDGTSFPRPGRVTFALKENGDGHWLAYHSHYSLVPGTPASTKR